MEVFLKVTSQDKIQHKPSHPIYKLNGI